MTTFAVAEHVEDARAQVDGLLAAVARATGHSALADAKVVALHGGLGGFAVLQHEGEGIVGVAVGVQPKPEQPVWNVQEATTAPGREELARRALEEAWARGARRVQWWAVQATGDDDALAARLGLVPWREVVQMRRVLPHPKPLTLPEGVRLRAFVPGDDDERWLEVNARAFAAHPEQSAFSLAELRGRMAEPWFDADDFLVAEDGEGMAGFCWVKVPDEEHGEIYIVGVDPRCQGTGLGRALVLAGLARMVGRGVPEARLYVDGENAAGLALYADLGFIPDHADRAYAADR